MKANTIIDEGTTIGTFREYVQVHHHHQDHYSSLFSEDVYSTTSYRVNDYSTQQQHLEAVLAAQDGNRLAEDLFQRSMNPSNLLRIIEIAGAPSATVKKAYERGVSAFTSAIEKNMSASAALGKACAAIRRAVTWKYLHCLSADHVVFGVGGGARNQFNTATAFDDIENRTAVEVY